jgi:predicted  nucleic acid-binding Zn-ribbon protein
VEQARPGYIQPAAIERIEARGQPGRPGPLHRIDGSQMSDEQGLRERMTRQGEEAIGKFAQELLENPMVTRALSAAFETRERASRAQEVAMGALNLPSASDLERLTRRLRGVSQRLESLEDGLDRLEERIDGLARSSSVERRLGAIEEALGRIETQLGKPS